jgi:hypothetical protein
MRVVPGQPRAARRDAGGAEAPTSPCTRRTRRAIEVCLFDAAGERETARIALPDAHRRVFHGFDRRRHLAARATACARTGPGRPTRATGSIRRSCSSIRTRARSTGRSRCTHRSDGQLPERHARRVGQRGARAQGDRAPRPGRLAARVRAARGDARPQDAARATRGATRSSMRCTCAATPGCIPTCRRIYAVRPPGSRTRRRSGT